MFMQKKAPERPRGGGSVASSDRKTSSKKKSLDVTIRRPASSVLEDLQKRSSGNQARRPEAIQLTKMVSRAPVESFNSDRLVDTSVVPSTSGLASTNVVQRMKGDLLLYILEQKDKPREAAAAILSALARKAGPEGGSSGPSQGEVLRVYDQLEEFFGNTNIRVQNNSKKIADQRLLGGAPEAGNERISLEKGHLLSVNEAQGVEVADPTLRTNPEIAHDAFGEKGNTISYGWEYEGQNIDILNYYRPNDERFQVADSLGEMGKNRWGQMSAKERKAWLDDENIKYSELVKEQVPNPIQEMLSVDLQNVLRDDLMAEGRSEDKIWETTHRGYEEIFANIVRQVDEIRTKLPPDTRGLSVHHHLAFNRPRFEEGGEGSQQQKEWASRLVSLVTLINQRESIRAFGVSTGNISNNHLGPYHDSKKRDSKGEVSAVSELMRKIIEQEPIESTTQDGHIMGPWKRGRAAIRSSYGQEGKLGIEFRTPGRNLEDLRKMVMNTTYALGRYDPTSQEPGKDLFINLGEGDQVYKVPRIEDLPLVRKGELDYFQEKLSPTLMKEFDNLTGNILPEASSGKQVDKVAELKRRWALPLVKYENYPFLDKYNADKREAITTGIRNARTVFEDGLAQIKGENVKLEPGLRGEREVLKHRTNEKADKIKVAAQEVSELEKAWATAEIIDGKRLWQLF